MTGDRDASTTPSDSGIPRRGSPHASRDRVRADGGAGPGRTRHRILRELRSELARHPAVRVIEGNPPEEYREVSATLNPSWFDRSAESASLRMTWIPDPNPGPDRSDRANDTWERTPIRAYYTVHYSEPAGFDCGFHCEPNPHVDGLLHYQERDVASDRYTYEPVSFDARSVSGLLWELLDALADRLADAE